MPAMSTDQTVEGPNPQGLKRSHLNTGVLEEFAQNMSENIIQSFQSEMEPLAPESDCRAPRLNQNQEMLAEKFASAVIKVALREVCGGPNLAVHHLEGLAVVEMDGMDSERSTKMNPGQEIQTSKDTQHCHPSLSQPGLTGGGSLNYPDAPATTPHLPVLKRIRHSFSRMLNGGMVMVNPPSTTLPTPNDGNDKGHGAASDPQVELMDHRIHSLFTNDSSRDCFEEGSRGGAKMAAFAQPLSCNREMLANKFASAVIEVALREVCGGPNSAFHHLEGLAGVEMDGMDSERSTKMNPGKEIQTSKDTRHCHPSLSQPGLTGSGSLDYPDAPPTTPLLPVLDRSRQSFSRMLKGVLAKVYPPSTPPPTPNDGNDKSHGAASDPQVELMEHLMHSLFTDDSSMDCFEEGSCCGAKMAAFAEALSRNIIDSVLSDKNGR